MPYYVNRIQNGTELYHHGILGQKWGVRRFQNKDGSLTNAGEKRYYTDGGNKVKYGVRGMRKIGASYDERVQRGKTLKANGGSTAKALASWLGRDALVAIATAPLSVAARSRSVSTGNRILESALMTATWSYSMANVVRTYQDISDMHAYERSKKREHIKRQRGIK